MIRLREENKIVTHYTIHRIWSTVSRKFPIAEDGKRYIIAMSLHFDGAADTQKTITVLICNDSYLINVKSVFSTRINFTRRMDFRRWLLTTDIFGRPLFEMMHCSRNVVSILDKWLDKRGFISLAFVCLECRSKGLISLLDPRVFWSSIPPEKWHRILWRKFACAKC